MKNIIYTLLFISLSINAFAQKDAQAKAILGPVSQKYRSFNAIKSDFTFTLDNAQAAMKLTQNGTLITEPKSNRYKIILYSQGSTTQVEQEIISDGKTQWVYNRDDKETQVSTTGHSNDDFNPAQIFTIYEHGYKYLYTGDQKIAGKVCQMIDLTAENTQTPIFKVRLGIDKVQKQIYSALVFDKNGNRVTYTLKTFTPNPPVTAATFTYDAKAHPGVELVDLR
ncbi:MAG: outer membrane lipoprotein carrier protein LolA [Mucilaginibacter sp.]